MFHREGDATLGKRKVGSKGDHDPRPRGWMLVCEKGLSTNLRLKAELLHFPVACLPTAPSPPPHWQSIRLTVHAHGLC